jgi:hypothetical protein
MTPLFRHAFRAFFALFVFCAPAHAADPLAEHLWVSRPLLIFVDTDKDPRLDRQLAELAREADALTARGVVIITDADRGVSRADRSELRKKYRPHGFTVILIGKDGEIALRRPVVVTADDITRQIDRMPMRLREMGRP